jgi:2-phospho-L-lactate guanylyltransferase
LARTAGKRRLSPVLGDDERVTLVRGMLEHVLQALASCPAVDQIAVLTPERDTVPPNIHLLPDAACGVNDALRRALQKALRGGADRVAIVAADLPLVTADEIASLVTASRSTGIALAPDRRGSGTNALCLAVPTPFVFRFGPGSLKLHTAEAVKLGIEPAVVTLPGLGFDLDEPEDLAVMSGR